MADRTLTPTHGENSATKEKEGGVAKLRSAEPRAIQLQRAVGNRTVQRLAKKSAAKKSAPTSTSPGTGSTGGRSLDSTPRGFMESRFNTDFSDVRVHTDDGAARSAADLDARAYTSGRDVYFGAGEYAPQSRKGRELLAHELTHVVQQGDPEAVARSGVVPEADPSEREAESVARQVVAGGSEPVRVSRKSSGGVHRAPLTAKDYEALAEQIYNASIDAWGTDEEAVFVALQKLGKNKASIKKLKDAYKKKYKRDLVDDLKSEMSFSELRFALELLGTKSSEPEERVAKSAPSTADEFKKAAARLHHAMKGGWTGWGTDEEAIYAALIPFKRDVAKITKLKAAYKKEHKTDLEADLKDEMSDEELAYALYLLKAPLAASPASPTTVHKVGTEKHKAKVEGGEVSVRTGVDYSAYVGGFSIGYQGGMASESRWLQFLWSEVLATQADKSVKRVSKSGLPTSNGTMELTTNLANPKYKVDSGSASSPFYEAGFTANRTSTGTTIYDRPSEFTSLIQKQFDAGATKVVERDYFDTYLVRDYRTIYHVRVVVEWVYTSKTSVTRKTAFKSGSKVSALPKTARQQLIKEYPKFDYIR